MVQGLAVVRGRLALSCFWLLGDILNGRLFVNADRGMLIFGGHVVHFIMPLYYYYKCINFLFGLFAGRQSIDCTKALAKAVVIEFCEL